MSLSTSGYTNCPCRDCFEIAVSSDMAAPELCGDCETAGCSADGTADCETWERRWCDEHGAACGGGVDCAASDDTSPNGA